MEMASRNLVRRSGRNSSTKADANDFLNLLKPDSSSPENKYKLWDKLKSMGDDKGLIKSLEEKGLIKSLEEKHISRMWEIAASKYEDIKFLTVFNDAAEAVKDVLPGTWIGKRGEKKGAWDALGFPWTRRSNGLPFEKVFEMTISAPDHRNQNQYRVEIIKGKYSSFLSIQGSPKSFPHSNDCVAVLTFGNQNDDGTNQIKFYVRFASSTVLVGKAFKANWKENVESGKIWRDIILAKSN